MQARYFALAAGVVYLLVGIVGLIPAFGTSPPASAPHVSLSTDYRYLLGQFPVNLVHDLLHILIGIGGILAFSRRAAAIFYARMLFLVYGVLALIGFLPHSDVLFGLAPIFGSDTWLHAGTALLAAYFGWVAEAPTYEPPLERHAAH